eukprot:gene25867-biopygen3030
MTWGLRKYPCGFLYSCSPCPSCGAGV